MKALRILILSLLVGLTAGALLARLFRSHSTEIEKAGLAPVPQISPKNAPVKAVSPAVLTKQIAPKKENEEPPRLEGNEVSFRVVHGLAIAFGDVLLGTPEQSELTEGVFIAPTPQLWDGNEIPYSIDPSLPNPERVKQAINYFHQNTGVKFVPYHNQPDSLVFAPGNDHCYSMLGRQSGVQPIYLDQGCQWHEIVHELMHALGFIHEQSRTDRDKYLSIVWENIEEKYRSQFSIVPDTFMQTVRDSPFDFQSIMLYEHDAFAKAPSLTTIKSLTLIPVAPSQTGLSALDLARLNKFYRQ